MTAIWLLPHTRLLVFLVMLCTSAGCSGGVRRMMASSPDYELYRQTRVAPTLEQRLSAGWLYLTRYPEGDFRQEVQGWFKRVEADYFTYAYPSRVRLDRYLEALPDGPHAEQARARIQELARAEQAASRRERRALERARAVTARLESAEEARKRFIQSVKNWVARLTAIRTWGGRTHELDHELIHAYRVEQPVATCSSSHCSKQLTMSYAIPDSGKLSERVAVFEVILSLREGAVAQAELTGPDLFSRLAEAVQRTPVAPDDAQRRAEAIAVSRQLVAGVLEAKLPGSACEQQAVSPVVLERECDGVRVRAVAALHVGGEDRIVVEPAVRD